MATTCNCSMRIKMVGSGCAVCNPDYWDDILKDTCGHCAHMIGEECDLTGREVSEDTDACDEFCED